MTVTNVIALTRLDNSKSPVPPHVITGRTKVAAHSTIYYTNPWGTTISVKTEKNPEKVNGISVSENPKKVERPYPDHYWLIPRTPKFRIFKPSVSPVRTCNPIPPHQCKYKYQTRNSIHIMYQFMHVRQAV
jgi:hypothetical protein